jgi:hypothetical protein
MSEIPLAHFVINRHHIDAQPAGTFTEAAGGSGSLGPFIQQLTNLFRQHPPLSAGDSEHFSAIDILDDETDDDETDDDVDGVDAEEVSNFDKFILNNQNKFQTLIGFTTLTSALQQPRNRSDFTGNFLLSQYPEIKDWLKYVKLITSKGKFMFSPIHHDGFKINHYSEKTFINDEDKARLVKLYRHRWCPKMSKVMSVKSICFCTRFTNFENSSDGAMLLSPLPAFSNNDVVETVMVISFAPKPSSDFAKDLRFNLIYIKHGYYDNSSVGSLSADVDNIHSLYKKFDSNRLIYFTNWKLVNGRGMHYDDDRGDVVEDAGVDLCTICQALPAVTKLLPCGHLFSCKDCNQQMPLLDYINRHCPLCRKVCTGTS